MKCLRIYAPRMGSLISVMLIFPRRQCLSFLMKPRSSHYPASRIRFVRSSRCSRSGLAYPARTSAAVWLDGIVEFETSDGELRRVSAGMRSWWRIHMEGAYLTASRRGAESVILVTLPHGLDSPEFN